MSTVPPSPSATAKRRSTFTPAIAVAVLVAIAVATLFTLTLTAGHQTPSIQPAARTDAPYLPSIQYRGTGKAPATLQYRRPAVR